MSFEIDISNDQDFLAVDLAVLKSAIQRTLEIEQVDFAVLSVSIVDNDAIHIINREHLQHDYPTDVISFQLDFAPEEQEEHDENDDDGQNTVGLVDDVERSASGCKSDLLLAEHRARGARIEGEIIASAEMASDMATLGNWTSMNELTLYVIHGLLHICGYDDLTPEEKVVMRNRERAVLEVLGLHPVYGDSE